MPSNVRLNVIYPRRYATKEGEKVHWMKVGVAWMGEKSIDVKLWLVPPANSEGEIRLQLREPLPEDEGQQPRRGEQPRPHRPAQYGGAASQQQADWAQPDPGDDIPF